MDLCRQHVQVNLFLSRLSNSTHGIILYSNTKFKNILSVLITSPVSYKDSSTDKCQLEEAFCLTSAKSGGARSGAS